MREKSNTYNKIREHPLNTEPFKTILGEDRYTDEYIKVLMRTFDDSNLPLTLLQKQYLNALKSIVVNFSFLFEMK